MSSNDFSPGLAGVVAFETEIAEPDKEGGELRYRGVSIEEMGPRDSCPDDYREKCDWNEETYSRLRRTLQEIQKRDSRH